MIYLIITTSINNKIGINNYEHRKNTYLTSIKNTIALCPIEIKPIIVENNGVRETYLDSLNIPVHYTNSNIINYPHKGYNELYDIKSVIEKFNINDDDFIIKLTGRYEVLNDTFFNCIIKNMNNNISCDAFIKFFNVCTKKYDKYDCVLGLFAIKCKY